MEMEDMTLNVNPMDAMDDMKHIRLPIALDGCDLHSTEKFQCSVSCPGELGR